jgi:DNA polymerase III alpha subunit (gram-positive type)
MMSDQRCDVCDSRRHVGGCTGFPGAIYAHHGQGWFSWATAHELEETHTGIHIEWGTVWSYSTFGVPVQDRIVVVDTETSGLDPDVNEMLEVAWHTVGHDPAPSSAVVPHSLSTFDRTALEVNRYRERDLGNQDRWCNPQRLATVLSAVFEGAVIGGSNVAFDKSFITAWGGWEVESWTHTPLEIGSLAMGYLGTSMPLRLREVAERLNLSHRQDHTAKGDVLVVVEALHKMGVS